MGHPRSILSRQLLPASIAIYTAVAIVAFEGLAITAALPEVAAELGRVDLLPWVITSFLLASAVTTAATGSFVDALGTNRVFRWAVLAFAASSLAAAFAGSMPFLIAARMVQGAASGAVISVGIAAVALVYPGHLAGRAFAANSNVWGVLAFASPALAALILGVGSWRWIFLGMVPLSAIALAAGWRSLPPALEPRRPRLDWLSAVLLTVAVGLVLGAVTDLSARSAPMLVAATAALAGLRTRTRRASDPLLDWRFVGKFPYGNLAAVASLTMAATTALSSYLPVYVRGVRGASPSTAAWSVLWLTIGWTLAANVAGRITDRVAERKVLTAGAVMAPLAVAAAAAAIVGEAPLAAVFACYFLMGNAVGTVTNSALQLVRKACPLPLAGRATSAHAFLRTMGLSVGAGIAGGVTLAVVGARLGDVSAVRAALAGEGGELAATAADALAVGFAFAHVVAFGLTLVAAALAWRGRRVRPAPGAPHTIVKPPETDST